MRSLAMDQSTDGAMGFETRVPSIALALMPQQQGEVRSAADDWTGIVDRGERRRLQNRLNQRAYRKRETKRRVKKIKGDNVGKAAQDTGTGPADLDHDTTHDESPTGSESPMDSTRSQSMSASAGGAESQSNVVVPSPPRTARNICDLSPEEMFSLADQYADWAYQAYTMGAPNVDNLLSLVQFNVFRAFVGNSNVLGFNPEWFADEEVISPFLKESVGSPASTRSTESPSWPVNLRPTRLQRTVEHHPWIDLFPLPRLRDNILEQGPDFDDGPLCLDVVEFVNSGPGEGSRLVVWGDPWDPHSWEVSEQFARKWSWLIAGCRELFQSTNQWRARRGEKPLFSREVVNKAVAVEEYDGLHD